MMRNIECVVPIPGQKIMVLDSREGIKIFSRRWTYIGPWTVYSDGAHSLTLLPSKEELLVISCRTAKIFDIRNANITRMWSVLYNYGSTVICFTLAGNKVRIAITWRNMIFIYNKKGVLLYRWITVPKEDYMWTYIAFIPHTCELVAYVGDDIKRFLVFSMIPGREGQLTSQWRYSLEYISGIVNIHPFHGKMLMLVFRKRIDIVTLEGKLVRRWDSADNGEFCFIKNAFPISDKKILVIDDKMMTVSTLRIQYV